MDLVVYKMVQFQVIHIAHRNRIVKRLAGTAVIQRSLSIDDIQLAFRKQHFILFGFFLLIHADALIFSGLWIIDQFDNVLALDVFTRPDFTAEPRLLQAVQNIFLACAVERRRHHLDAKLFGRASQMHFQHLTDIHTRRNAQRIQNDVQRRAVRKERHILRRKNSGNDAFVSVPASHFIADRDFSFLGDIHTDHFVDAGRQIVLIVS